MDRSAHGVQVVHQGHVGFLRAQLLLLCRDGHFARSLLAALRAMCDELLVREAAWDASQRTFRSALDGMDNGFED
eukprot:CAMPEP_0198587414 /NCGR_PEP_ID=MMETSP1462-20131121/131820_1 /TAXON_ID=1333877 /ORGANISM="Brandtodinium nutriculum, Strain RCC3387" /LENGTH=74 /DNA_ID=CAMNT_0044318893 /DNA_START=1 /DNA_END=222 /DNA_ORIENTATION=-